MALRGSGGPAPQPVLAPASTVERLYQRVVPDAKFVVMERVLLASVKPEPQPAYLE